MKISKLTIHNIASIESAEIDFDNGPLATDHIFLITGETGAGKSTILNAICLALYNQVPSLETIGTADEDREGVKTDNTRQLMRKGTGYSMVELLFTGNDDRRYLARWETQRARRKPTGRIQDTARRLEEVDSGKSYTLKKDIDNEIRRVVGLTFDQFTRTTMLAQGQFANFMKAKDGDKSDILEKITGTEIYTRIGKKINELCKAKDEEYKALEIQINAANLMDDETRAQHTAAAQALADSVKTLDALIADTDKRLGWLSMHDNLRRELAKRQESIASATAAADSEDHRRMQRTVAAWDSTAETRRKLADEAEAIKALADIDRRTLPLAEGKHHKILDGMAWLGAALARAAEAVADDGARKGELVTAMEKAEAVHSEAVTAVAEIEKEYAAFDTDTLTRQLTDTTNRLNATIGAMNIAAEHQRLTEERAKALATLNEAREATAKLKSRLSEVQDAIPGAKEQDTRLGAYLQGQMELKDHIASLRRRFADDNVCPLCGTPGVHLHDNDAIDAKVLEAQKAYDEAHQALDDLNKTAATLSQRLKVQLLDTGKKEAALKAADKALKDIEDKGIPAEDRETLAQRRTELEQHSKEVSARLEEAAAASGKLGKARREAERLRSDRDKAAEALSTQRQKAEELRRRVDGCTTATAPLAERFATPYTPTPRECRDIEGDIRDLCAEVNRLDGEKTTWSRKLGDLREGIARLLEASPLTREDIESLALTGESAVESQRNHIKEVEETIKRATYEAGAIQAQIEQHEASRPDLAEDDSTESLTAAKARTEAERNDAATERTRLLTLLASDEDNARKQQANKAHLEELRDERNEWVILDKSFGGADGGRFKRVAQSVVLRILLGKANDYLGSLAPRYRLDCETGSLTINVVDSAHGDTVRNVGLLSGGESFVVSLALALGLSAISKEKINVDTLFIDEGFGTLDSNTLDTVITVLDRLHNDRGRRIGIISHVQELKDRIPTQIQLVRTGPSSSKVIITNY